MIDGAGSRVALRRSGGPLPAVLPSPSWDCPRPGSAGADRPSALPAALLGSTTHNGVRRPVSPPMWSSRPSRSGAWAMCWRSPAITAHRGLAGRQTAAACRSHRRSPAGPLLASRQPRDRLQRPTLVWRLGLGQRPPARSQPADPPWQRRHPGLLPVLVTRLVPLAALVRVAGCAGLWRNASRGQGPGRAGPLSGAERDRLARFITLAMLALVFLMACAAAAAPAPPADRWHYARHGRSIALTAAEIRRLVIARSYPPKPKITSGLSRAGGSEPAGNRRGGFVPDGRSGGGGQGDGVSERFELADVVAGPCGLCRCGWRSSRRRGRGSGRSGSASRCQMMTRMERATATRALSLPRRRTIRR